jgi:hypothetical protein
MVSLRPHLPCCIYSDTTTAEVRTFILLALRRAVVKEVVNEVSLCLYRMYRPHLPSTNHVNAELYGALRIVTKSH